MPAAYHPMKLRQPLCFAAAMVAATYPASAGLISENYSFSGLGLPVADNGVPLPYGINLDGISAIVSLTEVQISLNLTGNPAGTGWAGDMFVSLNHDFGSQTAILLNQAGVNAGSPFGYGFDGWNVTFKDGAANGDVHLGQPTGPATTLVGSWQPDGRTSPLDTARPAQLGVFDGSPGSGAWTLTVADLAPGGNMTLNGFTLTLTGVTAVPEPAAMAVFAALGLLGFALCRRARR